MDQLNNEIYENGYTMNIEETTAFRVSLLFSCTHIAQRLLNGEGPWFEDKPAINIVDTAVHILWFLYSQ